MPRALSGADEVNAGCAAELGDPRDRVLHLRAGSQHHVRHLVEHHHQVRGALSERQVVDLLRARPSQILEPLIHLGLDVAQQVHHLQQARRHRVGQVTHAVERGELRPLPVRDGQSQPLRRIVGHQVGQERVEEHRLARPCRAGHQ